jgi:dihydrofolate reductase
MAVRAIVAVDENLAIGKDGALPWRYPADLRFFKQTTLGHTILMGRRTFESIGRPLPGRQNVVLTRRPIAVPGIIWAPGVLAALALHREEGEGDLFVIGGAQVYEAMARYIEEWVVTRVPAPAQGADTFLDPALFDGFAVSSREAIGDALIVERLWRAGT